MRMRSDGRIGSAVAALRQADLVRPPSLQTDEERSASRLELFFDLAFVLVIAELATTFREDFTLVGGLRFAALFTVVWWCWISATLYANRFDHDDIVYRLYKLGSMLAVIGMAATATEATGTKAGLFAACYVGTRLLLLTQYARAYRHVREARPKLRLYLIGAVVGSAAWSVSILVPAPARYVLWGVGVLAEVITPVLATTAARDTDVPLHVQHLPERFALFVILVLGEGVAGTAHGLHDSGWTSSTVPAAVTSFLIVAALWWSYFDLAGSAAKQLLSEAGTDRTSVAHDVYVYGQLALTLALAVIGVGIEHGVTESGHDEPDAGTRLVLAGGVALYLAAASLTNAGMTGTWRTGWWAPLIAAALALADAAVDLPTVVVESGLVLLLAVVLVVGMVQEARGRITLESV
jgi:low temperature requirement protein LtrA